MIGYKVVSVRDEQFYSCAQLNNQFVVRYTTARFVSGRPYPVWYYPTLKGAIEFITDAGSLHRRLQIWKCEVKETRELPRHTWFGKELIIKFWRDVYKLKTYEQICFKHGDLHFQSCRVAKYLKLLNPVTEVIDNSSWSGPVRIQAYKTKRILYDDNTR